MPLIIDPDDLNQATEIVFDTTAKTIQLLVAGNLSNDGATLKAVYSFTKEEWKVDDALVKFPFPFTPITDEFYELQEGWDWADATTRTLIRRAGWLVRDVSGNVTQHWAGKAVLSAEADDQIYYQLSTDTAPTEFTFLGNTAEAVQVIDDPNGDGNYADGFDKSANINVFNREQGQLYAFNSSSAVGESSLLAPKLFSLSLPTGTDLNVTESDANIAILAPYTGMSITFFATPQERDIGGTPRDFGVILDANNGTAEQLYEYIQFQLRQNSDIDAGAGTVIGQLADQLLRFTGGTGDGSGSLSTLLVNNPAGGGGGVYIDNYQTADTNRLTFVDNTGTPYQEPFVAVTQLNFNINLQNDSAAEYFVFFTDANGNNFGDTDAILVNDNSDTPVEGLISASAFIQFDFDYDNNVQGGRTAGTDAPITVVAIGLDTGQYVRATGTIQRSVSNTVSLVSPVERNYANPV